MKDKLINKLLQYVSDLHLEKGFKRNIIPKKPNLILGGDIGYVFKKSYEEFLLYKISPNFEKVFILSGNPTVETVILLGDIPNPSLEVNFSMDLITFV